MESAQPVLELPRTATGTRAGAALGWLRGRATTTPGRLVLLSILIAAGAVVFGVIETAAERSRAQAAQAARTQTEPLLMRAASLYTSLSDANATVTSALLTGGAETPGARARYLQDLHSASEALTTLTRKAGTSASARTALGAIADELPIYSGLVESARANNRQGFPIGAAYLREASDLLTGRIRLAADQLYAIEAQRLNDDYGTGTATATIAVFITAFAVSLLLLCLAQLYLARISRRILNVPMLLATVVLVAVSVWGLVGLTGEQNSLTAAQRNGSDSVEVLSATSVLLSRAQGDQSLTIVNRGTDQTDPADFSAVMRVLEPSRASGGLIGEVSALAQRTGTSAAATPLATEFASYRAQAAAITTLEKNGRIRDALPLAPALAKTSDQMSANVTAQIEAAQARFDRSAADATGALSGLWLAIPLLTVTAGALALLGLRQRMNEYR